LPKTLGIDLRCLGRCEFIPDQIVQTGCDAKATDFHSFLHDHLFFTRVVERLTDRSTDRKGGIERGSRTPKGDPEKTLPIP
uniref:Uncharacterized protein n=1 Tax=Amphimedon queenslandica TaxID=400682 RepID=A0A1X7TJZ0_AMPQE